MPVICPQYVYCMYTIHMPSRILSRDLIFAYFTNKFYIILLSKILTTHDDSTIALFLPGITHELHMYVWLLYQLLVTYIKSDQPKCLGQVSSIPIWVIRGLHQTMLLNSMPQTFVFFCNYRNCVSFHIVFSVFFFMINNKLTEFKVGMLL